MSILLATKGLTKRFAGLVAVDTVDFQLQEGHIHALIGPNGAGKTTFVSLLCGRIEPSAGTVSFQDQDITALRAHERIRAGMAYTFQITSVFGQLSVFENVALAARRKWTGKLEAEARVQSVLERLGLDVQSDRLAGELAYGHQRLLEVAMGIVQAPRLLIMDEPTQGLSDAEIDEFIVLTREMAKDATVLLIEHNMRVVMELAERVTVLNFGQILAEGTPEKIRENAHVQAAYLGTE